MKEKIKCSLDSATVARNIFNQSDSKVSLKEYFFVVLLNNANRVVGFYKLSEGGICGTVADIRLTFATALKSLATGIILIHNHPSGNLKPSEADKVLTQRFKKAGELLDVHVLDHIILTNEDYFSFSDEGQF